MRARLMRVARIPLSLMLVVALATLLRGEPSFPPQLPEGKSVATDRSPEMLEKPASIKADVKIAAEPPTVDFLYYQGQDYNAKLWSNWGDSLAIGNKCYSSIGDHTGPVGTAFLYEYDADTKELREVVDTSALLKLPAGHYSPGKIHSRIDLGSDGWLYFSTHRGSTRVTTTQYHYQGDWLLRYHPETKKVEVVAHAPLPMQCLPTSVLDPERLIYYAGTADGDHQNKRVQFLAYDIRNRKVLYTDDHGPYRYLIFAPSTGRVYWHGKDEQLVRFDPEQPGTPTPIAAKLGLRTATQETPQGIVYTLDGDQLWAFDTKTETAKSLGPTAAGRSEYTTSIDADSKTGRYLYYVPGAHGGAELDGSPLVQYDVQTNTRKVIAFLHPFYHKKYGFIPCGTFGTAVSPEGDKVYITWNGNRDTPAGPLTSKVKFNICAFMVVHIPESERRP